MTSEKINGELKSIYETAVTRNNDRGVSGILLFSNDYFLQALEGPREQVNNLYMKILVDRRHANPQILAYKDIQQRDFADWSMGWANETAVKRDIYFRYCAGRKFEPLDLTGEAAHALLCEFAELMRFEQP